MLFNSFVKSLCQRICLMFSNAFFKIAGKPLVSLLKKACTL